MTDVAVVGAGVLGASVAYHLLKRGARVTVMDQGPGGFNATRGNHGLVWAQDKSPAPYLALTLRSIGLYPGFARELAAVAGVDIEYERPGGLHFCLSEDELSARAAYMREQARTAGFAAEVLDRPRVRRLEPRVGPEVAGASFSALDGHLNPLALARALQAGISRLGGTTHRGWTVSALSPSSRSGWTVASDRGRVEAAAVVVAAGVGIPRLTRPLGLEVPVRPQRGQILVSAPLPPVLRHPSVPARQTRSGTVLAGPSHEEVGFDTRATLAGMTAIAARAVRHFPFLREVELIRSWGALRPLTPDSLPVFEQPAAHPGLYLATAHSGITLCPVVGEAFAEWIAGGRRPEWLPVFDRERFRAEPRAEAVPAPAGPA